MVLSGRTCALLLILTAIAGGMGPVSAGGAAAARLDSGTPLRTNPDISIHVATSDTHAPKAHEEVDLRLAEARIIAVQLMRRLLQTRRWRSVLIVPDGFQPLPLTLRASIIESDSNVLSVSVEAVDASGKRWLNKKYREFADPCAYESSLQDPFHLLYRGIVEDVLMVRDNLSKAVVRRLEAIARLRFAAELAPFAYRNHLSVNRKGRIELNRLPADNDALLARIDRIRHRYLTTVSVITDHYSRFVEKAQEPYDFYRGASYEVQRDLDTLRWVTNLRQLEYGVPMELYPSIHGRCSSLGPGPLIPKPIFPSELFAEFRSLTHQFNAEVEPALRTLDDATLRLQASLESRHAVWQKLVQRIAATEIGTPRNLAASQARALDRVESQALPR